MNPSETTKLRNAEIGWFCIIIFLCLSFMILQYHYEDVELFTIVCIGMFLGSVIEKYIVRIIVLRNH